MSTTHQNIGQVWAFTYDAFGHQAELSINGSYGTSYLALGGFKLSATGQTPLYSEYPLPGGSVLSQGGGGHVVQMADWLGTIRASWLYTAGGYAGSAAHAPFGETYANNNGGNYPAGFAGQGFTDTNPANTTYWFPERKLRLSQGRWLSPDPAGRDAADPSDPQSWNRYAYVGNNPLSLTDPEGLCDDGQVGVAGQNAGDVSGGESACDAWKMQAFGQSYYDLPGNGNQAAAGESGYLAGIPWYSVQGGQLYRRFGFYTPNFQYNPNIPDSVIGTETTVLADIGPANSNNQVAQIGPPQQYTPAKQPWVLSKYAAFLGCEYNSVVETITDEEDDGRKTAYGFMNAGALWAIRFKQANWIGITFVATAGAMDIGAMAKANTECTGQIYH